MNLKPYTAKTYKDYDPKVLQKHYNSSPGLLITPLKNQTLLGFI